MSVFGQKGLKFTFSVSSAVKLPEMQMDIGSQIKYYRKSKGMTQEDLAETMGVSKSSIIHIENDDMLLINLPLLDKLISYLDIKDKIKYEDEYLKFIINNPAVQIRSYRKKKNLTMYQLSEILKTSHTTVKRWECGESVISRKCFERLNKLFKEDFL